ncbi:MAG: hypothetical protein LBO71_03565, partial [Prevotellaceae bacterium]|nr:hypothetical protein [Prevotellaceae bacterium]
DDDDRCDEAFVQAMGDSGEQVLHNPALGKTFKERFRKLLRDFWAWVGRRLRLRGLSPEQISRLTFEQAVRGAVADVMGGKPIRPPGRGRVRPPKTSAKEKPDAKEKPLSLRNVINQKGEINYGELKRTADEIEAGRASLNRLSLAEERGRAKGGRRNVEASIILGGGERAFSKDTQERGGSQSAQNENDARERQEQLLEKWAREAGIFEEWEEATSKRKLYDSTGTESKVYEGSTPDTVVKIASPYQFSGTPLEFLDNRISLHNHLFPETAYKLIGVTKKGSGIRFILEQPRIKEGMVQNMDFSNPSLVEKYKAELGRRGLPARPKKAQKKSPPQRKNRYLCRMQSTNQKGEMSHEQLERTANAIEAGAAHLNRLSLAEEQGRRQGGKRNVEASVLLAAKRRANSAEIRDAGAGATGRGAEEQEQILKDYAQKKGVWITPEEVEKWKYRDTGMEARVYDDPSNPGYVLKVYYNYKNFSETPQEYLDNRISLHNHLFGESETGYELVGFTETHGATRAVDGSYFAPVVRQKHIQGRELEKGELPLLDAEMEKRGFDKINGVYVSKDYIVEDLHADNVMIDKDGNFHFIDTVPSLNTADDDFGGAREYGSGEAVQVEKATFVSDNSKQLVSERVQHKNR